VPPSNRAAILEGAIECVQTLGVAGTTTRDIAAAAGGSLASIPYHFGSKEELLTEALLAGMSRFTDHIQEVALATDVEDRDRLAASMAAFIDSMEQSRPMMVSLMQGYAHALHTPELRDRVAVHRRALLERIGLIVQVSLGDRLPATSLHTLSVLALSLIDGLIMHWLMDSEDLPSSAELVEALGADVPTLFDGQHA
jgi:AcrR family transcriptional regulator